MRDAARHWWRPALAALGVGVVVIAIAIGVAFALLAHWGIPPDGGDASGTGPGSVPARLRDIPAPRLQEAPQLERQEAEKTNEKAGDKAGEKASGKADDPPRVGSAATSQGPVFAPTLGATLPQDLFLRDEAGRPVSARLADTRGRATVLVPAYFRCDALCGMVAQGTLEALADSRVPPDRWRLVVFSFDPEDTPADAVRLHARYADYAAWARPAVFAAAPVPMQLLTSASGSGAALAHAIGMSWQDEAGREGWKAHPAGLVVLTPEGRISSQMSGVRFDPAALREALSVAREERTSGWTDRLLLACAHLDPDPLARSAWVMPAVRTALALFVLAFAIAVWRFARSRP